MFTQNPLETRQPELIDPNTPSEPEPLPKPKFPLLPKR